jgi:hypothetical protein
MSKALEEAIMKRALAFTGKAELVQQLFAAINLSTPALLRAVHPSFDSASPDEARA